VDAIWQSTNPSFSLAINTIPSCWSMNDKPPPWLPLLSHSRLYFPVRIRLQTSNPLSHPFSEFEMFIFLFGRISIFFRCLSRWT
jgi:hypothetical protein